MVWKVAYVLLLIVLLCSKCFQDSLAQLLFNNKLYNTEHCIPFTVYFYSFDIYVTSFTHFTLLLLCIYIAHAEYFLIPYDAVDHRKLGFRILPFLDSSFRASLEQFYIFNYAAEGQHESIHRLHCLHCHHSPRF